MVKIILRNCFSSPKNTLEASTNSGKLMGRFWDPISSNKMVRNQGKIEMNFEHEDLDLGKKENTSGRIGKNP